MERRKRVVSQGGVEKKKGKIKTTRSGERKGRGVAD